MTKYPLIVTSPRQQKGSLLSSMLLLILFAGSILVFADYLLQPDRFPVSRISFIGEFRHVEKSALQEKMAPYIGNNFFAIDLQKLEAALRDIDWVSDVSVSRRWPDTLQISVKEQSLIAAWNKTGWVTSDATIVEIPGLKMPGLPRWSGSEGTQVLVQLRFQQFSSLLADVGIQLRQLSYSQRGAWQISASNYLRNEQISIRLGRRDMQDRLYRFARAYGQTLGELQQRLISVDLRYPNGFAVKWNIIEEAAPVKTG
ncbi:MAG TPA: FtsQ-type POTRA domain-containing protein [Gammaproteobacteria bacterium]|nr:FtsQ-type POTRA domain-containing protein [Gammaproteobacteria bacterium]